MSCSRKEWSKRAEGQGVGRREEKKKRGEREKGKRRPCLWNEPALFTLKLLVRLTILLLQRQGKQIKKNWRLRLRRPYESTPSKFISLPLVSLCLALLDIGHSLLTRIQQKKIQEKQAKEASAEKQAHAQAMRTYIAKCGDLNLCHNQWQEAALELRSTKPGRKLYGACDESATARQSVALTNKIREGLPKVYAT